MIQFFAHDQCVCGFGRNVCQCLLIGRFGKGLIGLIAGDVHIPVLLKVPDSDVVAMRGHAVGKCVEEGIISSVAVRRRLAAHVHFSLHNHSAVHMGVL